jgi:hypothetical protein
MKLPPYQGAIETAYQAILCDLTLHHTRPAYSFNLPSTRSCHSKGATTLDNPATGPRILNIF